MLQFVRFSRWASPFKYLNSQSNPLLAFHISTTAESNPSRPPPPPIRVSLTESAGRGVFATRTIGSGELIHTAKPFVSHPSLSTTTSVCYLCLRKLSNRTSSKAQCVAFCSEECEEQSKMEKEFLLLRSVFKEAYVTDEQMAFLTKQWYIGVLARIRINAFRIELAGGLYEDLLSSAAASVEAEAAVGNSVYMLPSFYNHDCDPNSHIVWIENADARVKALRDIEAGEELRICYIDASMDADARQTVLSEGFGFRCRCLRCLSGD
ncbi:histone-lysine N-methyltransferase ATXR4-like isoform X3 [Actinidia eriantha]|uniref:histone-lysine N-methyltransferase ATXR4-like isoform X3 n=1 Tax=Actinidia eriantha TaxID=165200 RepID=UPI00258ACD84|nr:histone-lysine N-methyltransferase ATXR4-like isoform X3 [Actinidia eriantha]XP_057488932.1 histone-lysine N-methyltransferase ATXR4-like isoform X3 [Actinidia eriantha]